MRVGLYLSTLYGLYGFSSCVGTPGHEIHELVDDVAVKPCQWSRDAAEDDFLGHEQPDFVHVETLVGRTVQSAEACGEHVATGCCSRAYIQVAKAMAMTAIAILVPATVQSRWMS